MVVTSLYILINYSFVDFFIKFSIYDLAYRYFLFLIVVKWYYTPLATLLKIQPPLVSYFLYFYLQKLVKSSAESKVSLIFEAFPVFLATQWAIDLFHRRALYDWTDMWSLIHYHNTVFSYAFVSFSVFPIVSFNLQ